MHWEIHCVHPQCGYTLFLDMLCQASSGSYVALCSGKCVQRNIHRYIDQEYREWWQLSAITSQLQETRQEMGYPNIISVCFATLLAFNTPYGGVPWGDLRKILNGGQKMAKVQNGSHSPQQHIKITTNSSYLLYIQQHDSSIHTAMFITVTCSI